MENFYAQVEFTTRGHIEVMASTIEEARQKIADMRLDTQNMDFIQDGWNPEVISIIDENGDGTPPREYRNPAELFELVMCKNRDWTASLLSWMTDNPNDELYLLPLNQETLGDTQGIIDWAGKYGVNFGPLDALQFVLEVGFNELLNDLDEHLDWRGFQVNCEEKFYEG